MQEKVIFCESYGEIAYTLSLAQQTDSQVHIVVPGFPDLFKFLTVVNERVFGNSIDVIYLDQYIPKRVAVKGIQKLLYLIPDIIEERRFLQNIYEKYFVSLSGAEIVFVSRCFSGMKVYLFKKDLCAKNTIVRVSFGPSQMEKTPPANLTELVKLFIWKMTYGWSVVIGKLEHYRGFLYIPDSFLEKTVTKVVAIDEVIHDFDISSFRIFNEADTYKVLFYDDDLISSGYVDDSPLYKAELGAIFTIVQKYFSGEITSKLHPGQEVSNISIGDTLPQFIPAEFFCTDPRRIYLSISSLALANVEEGFAISLIDLITFKDDEVKRLLKEFLLNNQKTQINFPQTLDELEDSVKMFAGIISSN